MINKHKMAKHFDYTITHTSLAIQRRHDQHRRRSRPATASTCYAPPCPPTNSTPPGHHRLQKPANIERDFRIIKADDLDLRPIHHRLDERVKAHVLICMLACYLVWHLRKAWAPMTFTDEHPPQRDNPVAPAQRSAAADAKASTHHDAQGNPLRSFRGLLTHLATLTRNHIRFTGTDTDVPILTDPPTTSAAPSPSSAPPSTDRRVERNCDVRHDGSLEYSGAGLPGLDHGLGGVGHLVDGGRRGVGPAALTAAASPSINRMLGRLVAKARNSETTRDSARRVTTPAVSAIRRTPPVGLRESASKRGDTLSEHGGRTT